MKSTLRAHDADADRWIAELWKLTYWRNAIAHHDFSKIDRLALPHRRSNLLLDNVRRWRRACDALARSMDAIMAAHLTCTTGVAPW